MSNKSTATATASTGFPLLTLALIAGLVMRYAVVPGTTWAGIDVHYAGGILIVVALIPLALLVAALLFLGLVFAVAWALNAHDRRARRKRAIGRR